MNRFFCVFCVMLCLLLAGCSVSSGSTPDEATFAPTTPDTLTYTIGEMKLTLPYASVKTEAHGGFDAEYWTEHATVSVCRYDKSEYNPDLTLYDVAKANQLNLISFIPSSVLKEDNFMYFELVDSRSDSQHTYAVLHSFLESDKAFWQLVFVCSEEDYTTHVNAFKDWIQGVTFEE